ncbi:MAG: RNA-binding protein [Chlamydiales bacterium]|nr:RNA-binding protein [Chlamydiales bacterium]
MKLYVGNIERTATEDDLRELFQGFGNIVSLTVIKDRYTNESRGFGFVEYADKEEAKNAMQAVNGQMLNGRSLKVNEAQEREERPRGAGGSRDFGGHGGGHGGGRSSGGGGYGSRDDSRGGGKRDFGGGGGGRSRFGS